MRLCNVRLYKNLHEHEVLTVVLLAAAVSKI